MVNEKPKIRLVAASELSSGRGGGKKGSGERYAEYRSRVKPIAGWLRGEIGKAPDKTVRVLTQEIADAIGMPLKIEKGGAGLHKTSLYWGLKRALFFEDVIVSTGTTQAGAPVLVMRKKGEGDRLPRSLLSEEERTALDAEIAAKKAAVIGGGGEHEEKEEEVMPDEVKEELGEPGNEEKVPGSEEEKTGE